MLLTRQRVFATSLCELTCGAGVNGEEKRVGRHKTPGRERNLSPSIRALPLPHPQSTEQTHGRAVQTLYPVPRRNYFTINK